MTSSESRGAITHEQYLKLKELLKRKLQDAKSLTDYEAEDRVYKAVMELDNFRAQSQYTQRDIDSLNRKVKLALLGPQVAPQKRSSSERRPATQASTRSNGQVQASSARANRQTAENAKLLKRMPVPGPHLDRTRPRTTSRPAASSHSLSFRSHSGREQLEGGEESIPTGRVGRVGGGGLQGGAARPATGNKSFDGWTRDVIPSSSRPGTNSVRRGRSRAGSQSVPQTQIQTQTQPSDLENGNAAAAAGGVGRESHKPPSAPASADSLRSLKGLPRLEQKRLMDGGWRDVLTYYDLRASQQNEMKRVEEVDKKAKNREMLDAQVALQRQLRDAELEDERNWYEQERNRWELWQKEEDDQKKKQMEHFARIRQERLAQVEETSKLRKRERELRIQEEKQEQQRILKRIVEDSAEQKAKKKAQQKEVRRQAEENNRIIEQRKLDIMKEMEEDKRLAEEYIRLLEKQDNDRKAALARTYHQQAKRVAMHAAMQESINELQEADNRKAERERIEFEREQDRKMAEREQRRIDAAKEQCRALQEQLKHVEAARQREIEEQKVLAEAQREDAKRAMEEVQDQIAQERKRNVAHRKALEGQIRENAARRSHQQGMTEAEIRYNSSLLRNVLKGRAYGTAPAPQEVPPCDFPSSTKNRIF